MKSLGDFNLDAFQDLPFDRRKILVDEICDRLRELSQQMVLIGRFDVKALLEQIAEGLFAVSFMGVGDGAGILQSALSMMDAVEEEISSATADVAARTSRH